MVSVLFVFSLFATFRKKGPKPKYIIYEHELDKNSVCRCRCVTLQSKPNLCRVLKNLVKTLPYVWKIISKKWTTFMFGGTYLHQTFSKCMSKINIHILTYRQAWFDCQLWYAIWFYYIFWYFYTLLTTIRIWIVVSPPNFHRLCV